MSGERTTDEKVTEDAGSDQLGPKPAPLDSTGDYTYLHDPVNRKTVIRSAARNG